MHNLPKNTVKLNLNEALGNWGKQSLCNITNLSKRCKTIGGTTCVGDYIHVWLVCLLINPNNKHGCISWRGRNYHFLCTTLQNQWNIKQKHVIFQTRVMWVKCYQKLWGQRMFVWKMHLQMGRSLWEGSEYAWRLDNVISSKISPRDLSWISEKKSYKKMLCSKLR